MHEFRPTGLGLLLCLVLAGQGVRAAEHSPNASWNRLIVFGDSLLDIGNAQLATQGLQPGAYYADGRFTNGPVFAELVAEGLGIEPLRPSDAGGDDFAFGGASTSGTGGLEGLVIRDIDEQIDAYLAREAVTPGTLFLVLAGANDLVSGQSNVGLPVANLTQELQRLIAAGAEDILVLNLPLLGLAPRFNQSSVELVRMNQLTRDFNTQLSSSLDQLEVTYSEVILRRFDLATLFDDVADQPAEFGFSTVSAPAAPGLVPGTRNYDTGRIATDPNQYVFWDSLHPTAAAHALIADRLLAAVAEPIGTFPLLISGVIMLARRRRHGQRPR